jgi:hypothetical protein
MFLTAAEQTNKSPESKDSYKGRMAIRVFVGAAEEFSDRLEASSRQYCAVMTEQRMQGIRELQC